MGLCPPGRLGELKEELKGSMVSIDWQLFNVLVVDDDPFQRSIVAKLLGQLGINKVVSADDGHAAAVQLAKNFDLIF